MVQGKSGERPLFLLMMKKPWSTLVWIIIIAMVAIAIVKPNGRIRFYNFDKSYEFSQGLDLQGGVHLEYALELDGVPEEERAEAIQGVKNVMEKRINPLGVSEPVIQTAKIGDSSALIIELPGQKDIQQAIDTIGKIAKLTFQEQDDSGESLTGYKETGLTGADLRPNGAAITLDQTTRAPIINLSFTEEGGEKFAGITARNVNKPLAIFLDDQPLQVATVQQAISGGQAQISGNFTIEEAQDNVRLLNAGALPVPLRLVVERNIGASLGEESIKRSFVAGVLGLAAVALFMIGYYRRLGLIAVAALSLYTLISLAIFKALPVTLTLAGITGFILSIGMAVDANILIFERYKEERKKGKSTQKAIHDGFERAWSSIRDSNASSIITALILYNFASSSLIKGFSLTLIIGILVSLFTAVTVSRTLLYLVMGTRLLPGEDKPQARAKKGTMALAEEPIKPAAPAVRRGRW